MIRGPLLLACAAFFSSLACEDEVTFHLFKTDTGSDGDADSSAGAGGSSVLPCQKIGSEVCNGGDDDCNGQTDEGCDYTVVWQRAPEGPLLGHAPGGVMFLQPCPEGSVLIGMREGMGDWLTQVSAVCRQIELREDATQSPESFTVTLGPRLDTPFVPFTSPDPTELGELLCPDGSILSGLDGTTSEDEHRYILGIRFTCAPPIVTMQLDGPILDTDLAREAMAGPIVCAACRTTQPYNFATKIPRGHVATGLFGAAGQRIDRVGLGASVASITRR